MRWWAGMGVAAVVGALTLSGCAGSSATSAPSGPPVTGAASVAAAVNAAEQPLTWQLSAAPPLLLV